MRIRMQTRDFDPGTRPGTVTQQATLFVVQLPDSCGRYSDIDEYNDVNEAKARAATYSRTYSVLASGPRSFPARTVQRVVTDVIV